jgi:hypothetical protein
MDPKIRVGAQNRWIDKLSLSFWISAKEGESVKRSKQPINQSPWAGRGGAEAGHVGGDGEEGGAARPEGPAVSACFILVIRPEQRRHPPPCIDHGLGPAHMFRGSD